MIFAAIIVMIAFPAWLGHRLLQTSESPIARFGATILGGVLGVCGSCATFYEDTWSPPPTLTFETPPGFRYDDVMLIEDPRSTTTIRWTGFDVPFSSRGARLVVPSSGIVRVRSLRTLQEMRVEGRLSTGETERGGGAGPLPASLGRGVYAIFNFGPWDEHHPGLSDLPEAALGPAVLAREAGQAPQSP